MKKILRNSIRWWEAVLYAVCLALCIWFTIWFWQSKTPGNYENHESKATGIVRVVDGDTVVVRMDGEDIKVRMIGVNTPESVSPDAAKNSTAGEIASVYSKKHLKEGMTVYLEYDLEREDKYNRTLAYVWLLDRKSCDYGDFDDFCKYNYGAILMQNTYCEAAYYPPNGKYRLWYEKLQITRSE